MSLSLILTDCRCCSGLDLFMLALRVSELVLVSLLTVLLFRAGGNQRPPGEIKVAYHQHDDTVNYENVEESSASSRLKWVYEGKDVEKQHQNVRTTVGPCYADVSAPTHHLIYKPGHNSLQCEVSEGDNKQLFPFRLQLSGEDKNHEKPTQQPSRTTTETPEQPTSAPRPTGNRERAETTPTPETKEASDGKDCRCCSGLDFFMLALRVSELVLVSLLTVLLFRAGGNQRPPGEIKVRFDQHDDTVHYENVEESSSSSRVH
ncbi:uncharacterized protein LOC141801627 [Halichoeres trimaculatus]|uniref:uncharacterized protein LOC141801627 n=1 Tax=Halichoeres trimaculatus TaxID=147232 RepID=UPI003D9E6925